MTNLSVAERPDEAVGALPKALPAWVYNNGELTRLELERILLPSWQIVCHVNSIPKAGDYIDTSAAAITGERANHIRIAKAG